MIRDGDWKQIPDYILRGKDQGMQFMKDSIEELVSKGIIDIVYLKDIPRRIYEIRLAAGEQNSKPYRKTI